MLKRYSNDEGNEEPRTQDDAHNARCDSVSGRSPGDCPLLKVGLPLVWVLSVWSVALGFLVMNLAIARLNLSVALRIRTMRWLCRECRRDRWQALIVQLVPHDERDDVAKSDYLT